MLFWYPSVTSLSSLHITKSYCKVTNLTFRLLKNKIYKLQKVTYQLRPILVTRKLLSSRGRRDVPSGLYSSIMERPDSPTRPTRTTGLQGPRP